MYCIMLLLISFVSRNTSERARRQVEIHSHILRERHTMSRVLQEPRRDREQMKRLGMASESHRVRENDEQVTASFCFPRALFDAIFFRFTGLRTRNTFIGHLLLSTISFQPYISATAFEIAADFSSTAMSHEPTQCHDYMLLCFCARASQATDNSRGPQIASLHGH